MSVQHRPERSRPWRVRWREEGRDFSRSFSKREDAYSFDAHTRVRLEGGKLAASQMLLDDWLERWIETHGIGWKPSTLDQRARTADRHISPHLGGVRLRDLHRQRLRAWKRDLLRAGASGHAVNSASRVLSAALSDAADDGLLERNPLLGMRAVPQARTERGPVPLDVIDATLDRLAPAEDASAYAHGIAARNARVVGLMAFAGLRPQEVRALRWSDMGPALIHVSRAADRAHEDTKTAAGRRSVRIRGELATLLDRGEGLVCPGDRGGLLDWHNWSTRVWRPALPEGEHHVPYAMRHTYASMRIAEGASIVEVQVEMGHSSPEITLRYYAHLFDAAREARRPAVQSAR